MFLVIRINLCYNFQVNIQDLKKSGNLDVASFFFAAKKYKNKTKFF